MNTGNESFIGNFDPFFHRNWIEALRSGKYKSGQGVLKQNHLDDYGDTVLSQFCCLGVACNEIDPSGWRKAYVDTDILMSTSNWSAPDPFSVSNSDITVPDPVAYYYGIYTIIPMGMNDTGWTFDEIASALEVMVP